MITKIIIQNMMSYMCFQECNDDDVMGILQSFLLIRKSVLRNLRVHKF